MGVVEGGISVVMLGAFIWVLLYLFPKARREHDGFALVCALLTAMVALIGWLFLGKGVR